MIERERTFLARMLPDNLIAFPSKEVFDIYIPRSSAHPVLRIRKNGDAYEMTKKEPVHDGDSSEQLETTIPLTKEEFGELSLLEGKRVRKIRYFVPWNNCTLEVELFKDALEGLVLVEVEFNSTEEKDAFVPPDFCLADVTQEEFTAGGMLCGKSYKDIEKDLQRYDYKPILP